MPRPTAAMPGDHHRAASAVGPATPAVSRRDLFGASAVLAAASLAGVAARAFGQQPVRLTPTSDQVRGPFYPRRLPADQDADLTVIARRDARALGQVVYLSGRVLDLHGAPVADAVLEIWQANAAGRYRHPGDVNPAALDPNFEGYAKMRTGPDGRYAIKTVKPGAYSTGMPDWTRPPHIHFDISGRSSRLVTQMYFEGEALNDADPLLQEVEHRETLMAHRVAAAAGGEPGAITLEWDIVLMAG